MFKKNTYPTYFTNFHQHNQFFVYLINSMYIFHFLLAYTCYKSIANSVNHPFIILAICGYFIPIF